MIGAFIELTAKQPSKMHQTPRITLSVQQFNDINYESKKLMYEGRKFLKIKVIHLTIISAA
jgi:hypothetical protein